MPLHYILHVSCYVLVLWILLQKKTIPRPFHSWFISLIPESWHIYFFIYIYQYLYGAIDFDSRMVTSKNFLKVLAPQNDKPQNYFDQLKSISMWVTNQKTLWWGQEVWLWSHGFWWWDHEFYDRTLPFNLKVYEHKFINTIEATKRGP